MPLDSLIVLLNELNALRKVVHRIRSGTESQMITGVANAQKSLMIGNIYRQVQTPICVITYSIQQAERIFGDLTSLLSDESVTLFPAIEILAHEETRPGRELLVNRARVLESIYRGERSIIVLPIKALVERMIPKSEYFRYVTTLSKGQSVSFDDLTEHLVLMGYERVDMVDEKGQFSVRGGLIDVFPLTLSEPVRIEFFGDEIESIRTFDPDTQRSKTEVEGCFLMPAREFVLSTERLNKGLELLQSDLDVFLMRIRKAGKLDAAQRLEDKITVAIEKFNERMYFDGIGGYKPYFYDRLETVLDYVGPSRLLVIDEFDRMREYLKNDQEERGERYLSLLDRGEVLPKQFDNYLEVDELLSGFEGRSRIFMSLLDKGTKAIRPSDTVNIPSSEAINFHGQMEMFTEKVRSWKKSGKRVVIVLATQERVTRLGEALAESDVQTICGINLSAIPSPHTVTIMQGYLQSGFELPSLDLIVLTDVEVFLLTIIITRDRTRSNVRVYSNSSISNITEMRHLTIISDNGLLYFNKSPHLCILLDHSPRSYIRIWTNRSTTFHNTIEESRTIHNRMLSNENVS
jgi:transcription-repair coupling factor (superfamily II helicase)